MVWQALILYKIAWNFNMLLVITISNSLGKIIQFEPSLYIKPLVAIAYFVIPTLSGVICCGGKQRKLARKNFDLYVLWFSLTKFLKVFPFDKKHLSSCPRHVSTDGTKD